MNLYTNYTTTVFSNLDEVRRNCTVKQRSFTQFLLPLLPKDRAVRILDVGCGYGAYMLAMRNAGYVDVKGIDLSQEQVKTARDIFGLNDVQQAEANSFLKQHTEDIDVILLCDVLEHINLEAGLELLESIKHALRPGGRLIVMVPNAICPFAPYVWNDITHQRAYTVHSLEQSFRMAGLARCKFHPTNPFASSVLGRFRAIVWRFVVCPIVRLWCFLCYGQTFGGIFTINIIAVAEKI